MYLTVTEKSARVNEKLKRKRSWTFGGVFLKENTKNKHRT